MREIVTNQGMIFRVPPGYRFMPTEEELINFYLKSKDIGLPIPGDCLIERDVYGDLAPWDLFNDQDPWEMLVTLDEQSRKPIKNQKILYVFTKLKRLSENRIRRTAGCGTWGAQNRVEIKNRKKEVIGFKKFLVYRANKGSNSRNNNAAAEAYGHWIMHEFSLGDEVTTQSDYVLCRIKRDGSKCLKERPKIQKNLEQHIRSSVRPQVESPGHAQNLSKRKSEPEAEAEDPQRKKTHEEVSNGQALMSIAEPVPSLCHQPVPVPAIEQSKSQKPWDPTEVCATEMIDEYLLKYGEESNCLVLSGSRPELDDHKIMNKDMDLFELISHIMHSDGDEALAQRLAPAEEVLSQNLFYNNVPWDDIESMPSNLHQVPTSSSNTTNMLRLTSSFN